jgi:SagB-type dehydrogenase family enzyme
VNAWPEHVVVRRVHALDAVAKSADTLVLHLPLSTVTIRNLDPGVHAALLALDTGALTLATALRTARAALPAADTGRLVREMGRLYARAAYTFAVEQDGETLCELSATGTTARLGLVLDGAPRRYRMSRFVLLRRRDAGLTAESLIGAAQAAIHRAELAAVLAALGAPATEGEIAGYAPRLPVPVLRAFLRLMAAAGVIGPVDRDGRLPEDREPELAMRDPHDLYLHQRSRIGLTKDNVGGTYRFAGVVPPLPATRPARWRAAGERLPLPRPDLDRLVREDLPLTAAMERRRSRRRFADRPLALVELGEFLYRVFRVQELLPADPADPRAYAGSLRPIPSAGDAHDLEVYLAVGRVGELGPGMYHYDPVAHALTRVAGPGYPVSAILGTARMSANCPAEPPVVVVLASRFGRLAWKYEGLAYSATLKNVGVAYEAMYLAATAMGLHACGLGSGDAGAFAAITGTAPHVESSVGEFMIGPAA